MSNGSGDCPSVLGDTERIHVWRMGENEVRRQCCDERALCPFLWFGARCLFCGIGFSRGFVRCLEGVTSYIYGVLGLRIHS